MFAALIALFLVILQKTFFEPSSHADHADFGRGIIAINKPLLLEFALYDGKNYAAHGNHMNASMEAVHIFGLELSIMSYDSTAFYYGQDKTKTCHISR